jgi:hypothetical protein
MKNVTITLDEETAAWARIHAAQQNMSVSRMIGEMLQKQMEQSQRYETAMQRYLAKPPVVLKPKGNSYPTREKVHERSRLR